MVKWQNILAREEVEVNKNVRIPIKRGICLKDGILATY